MRDDIKAEIRERLQKGIEAKESYERVKQSFNSIQNPSVYGKDVPKWSPDYEYVHDMLLRTIRPYMSGSGKLLDIGAGTGRLSKIILETFNNCHITLLDISESLLSEVPNKLDSFPGQYESVQGDCFDSNIEFPSASFDCVVSAFSICHGREEIGYRSLYQRIYKWLKPESCFICLDHVYASTPELTVLGFEDWEELLEQNFGEEGAYKIIINAIHEDSPLSLSKHLELLSQVGFDAVDVLWKRNVFALYIGLKTAKT